LRTGLACEVNASFGHFFGTLLLAGLAKMGGNFVVFTYFANYFVRPASIHFAAAWARIRWPMAKDGCSASVLQNFGSASYHHQLAVVLATLWAAPHVAVDPQRGM
jgi:hypothetical protein